MVSMSHLSAAPKHDSLQGTAEILPWLVAPGAASDTVPDAAPVQDLLEEQSMATKKEACASPTSRTRLHRLLLLALLAAAVLVAHRSAHAVAWVSGNTSVVRARPAALRRTQIAALKPKNETCIPSRKPQVYGEVNSYPPEPLTACTSFATRDIFNEHDELVSMSWARFANVEVLMLGQMKGGIYYMEVVFTGDLAHYQIRRYEPLKVFRGHSCLDSSYFCYASFTKPMDPGFLVLDRHRVMQYNYTWLPEETLFLDLTETEEQEEKVATWGQMNARVAPDEGAFYPTAVALYYPLNSTHIDETFAIHPRIMPMANLSMVFVTDTGNHRVLILDASVFGSFELIGQFGITGETRQDDTGLNWPWGIEVYMPAWESLFEPVFANVFVADRRNNRVLKLNFGYPLVPCDGVSVEPGEPVPRCRYYDTVRLGYSAEYGSAVGVRDTPQGLDDPTAVAVYRHYVIVAEAQGKAVTVLQVDHQNTDRLLFVTHFEASAGMSLHGNMCVSEYGFVWFDYMGTDLSYYFASFYLPEALRLSIEPSRLQDYLTTCVNESWHNEQLLENATLYMEYMGFVLNASRINWLYPDMPDYVDIWSFNTSTGFDLDLLDQLVFNGTMTSCTLPPPPTSPPLLSGNADGWAMEGNTQAEYKRRSAAPPRPGLSLQNRILRFASVGLQCWFALGTLAH